ncbi:glycosyltransferase [Candidatus Parcubacteria bacterium]|nr:MAG: glycosyltransferase [Candidatus Parcubacteria bacterium]
MTSYRPRAVFILPEYDAATGSHFSYIYALLGDAASALDLLVIAERARGAIPEAAYRIRAQRFAFGPLRLLELFVLLLAARISGVRHAYVHYSIYGGLAAWLVFGCTGGRAYYWNCGMPWLYRRNRFAEAAFRFVLRHAILVTGTPGLAVTYARIYGLRPDRIRVLPNGIDVDLFGAAARDSDIRQNFGIAANAPVVFFAHRLSRRKGADLLPDIAARILARMPRAMVLIAGDGPEREAIRADMERRGIASGARLLGSVPQRDIAAYFGAADAFLMPSEEEGFPHVLLEAMAARTPYVATDVGGVREITPPALTPYLAPSGNSERIAEALIDLLERSANERRAIGEIEAAWVRRYDRVIVRDQFIALFTK